MRTILTATMCVLLLGGCTDEGEGDNAGGGGSPSSGGAPPIGGAGGSPEGGGGAGGAGGAGGSGGEAPAACLDASVAAASFSLAASDLCIVASYPAAGLDLPSYGATPSWGAHGGPLTVAAAADGSSITLTRWALSGGSLSGTEQVVALSGVPVDAFFGPLAVESEAAPGSNCVGDHAVSVAWTGSDFFNVGAIITVDGAGVATSRTATGVFGMAASGTHVLYTGLSEVAGPAVATAGLYSADSEPCGTGLLSDGTVETGFGNATGPVAIDRDGHVFAILSDYLTGRQLIHGYLPSAIAAGGAATGVEIADLEGYGDALAAVPPEGAAPGLVVFQPNGGVNGDNLDVIAVEYSTAGSTLAAGLTKPLLTLAEANHNLTLMTDDQGRLWVGSSDGTDTTFFVLDRPPAD